MASALLLHLVVTGALAVVLSCLVSAQWLLARLSGRVGAERDEAQAVQAPDTAASAAPSTA